VRACIKLSEAAKTLDTRDYVIGIGGEFNYSSQHLEQAPPDWLYLGAGSVWSIWKAHSE
jgi:hypothetical protein